MQQLHQNRNSYLKANIKTLGWGRLFAFVLGLAFVSDGLFARNIGSFHSLDQLQEFFQEEPNVCRNKEKDFRDCKSQPVKAEEIPGWQDTELTGQLLAQCYYDNFCENAGCMELPICEITEYTKVIVPFQKEFYHYESQTSSANGHTIPEACQSASNLVNDSLACPLGSIELSRETFLTPKNEPHYGVYQCTALAYLKCGLAGVEYEVNECINVKGTCENP